jgi:hypothetical protein
VSVGDLDQRFARPACRQLLDRLCTQAMVRPAAWASNVGGMLFSPQGVAEFRQSRRRLSFIGGSS